MRVSAELREGRLRLVRASGIAVALLAAVVLVIACTDEEPPPDASPSPTSTPTETATPAPGETATPEATASPEPTAPPEVTPPPDGEAGVVQYDLGEAFIIQSQFPEGSRFREMPVSLRGVLAVPDREGRHPVVMILHGSHPICTAPGGEVGSPWPCPPDQEIHNYGGFEDLALSLARRGYVAFAPDINAQFTFAFGEANGLDRIHQLVALHLEAITAAVAGDDQGFGIDLRDKVDLSRAAVVGHSRGGDFASTLARDGLPDGPDVNWSALLLIAPPLAFPSALPVADVPLAVVLPACDGDVRELTGQGFHEFARTATQRESLATSVYLERANHNGFNSIVGSEWGNGAPPDRPDCDQLLEPNRQQEFLAAYAADFLDTAFGDGAVRASALGRLGADPSAPVPSTLYGLPARVVTAPSTDDRLRLLGPLSEGELREHLQGGAVEAESLDLVFCAEGYTTPVVDPESAPCKRVNFTQPGNPAVLVVTWDAPGARLRLALPESTRDLSGYASISIRVAVDPLAEGNAEGEPGLFSVMLSSEDGSASVALPIDEPALAFPRGVETTNDLFEGGYFTGIVLPSTVRIPLDTFEGVDLGRVSELALVFDRGDSGSLFIADLELLRR